MMIILLQYHQSQRQLYYFKFMPKVVDNYVFQRKIGSGQYGDVYKGYNKNDTSDIAIKAIKRENISGKFLELLENEIKVLKTCDNRNIIKLYDIKKTANNFYLILEYCNEGDLAAFLKKTKTMPEKQAIEFFLQILNAFKTLVKHKIMHRDFKLANILLHDGEIKIADFGFSKLLANEEFTGTILGSPLNMAPEVLGGTTYNSKADIWSIGVVFYQMLFGGPPYKASNMVDLVNNIKNKPLHFPKQINAISEITEDVLRRMLVVDPVRRIQWEVLFAHPIVTYLQEKMKKQMELTMQDTEDVTLNMSKFYLKANLVVEHPKQIEARQDINNYAYDVVAGKQAKQGFQGEMIRRETTRKKSVERKPSLEKTQEAKTDVTEKEMVGDEETLREKQIRAFKKNTKYLLHRRNIYVFLASVAQEAIELGKKTNNSDVVGYLLIRKLLQLLQRLREAMDRKQFKQMQYWELFMLEKDYKEVRGYVEREYDVFKVFYQSVHTRIADRVRLLDKETQEVILHPTSSLNEKVYQKNIRDYLRSLTDFVRASPFKTEAEERKMYTHLHRVVDCLALEDVFYFEKNGTPFNFRNYYEEPELMDLANLKAEVARRISYV